MKLSESRVRVLAIVVGVVLLVGVVGVVLSRRDAGTADVAVQTPSSQAPSVDTGSAGTRSAGTATQPASGAAPAPITESELLSAPVPASCRHAAGRLQNGSLPLAAGTGSMSLVRPKSAAERQKVLLLGDFTGDGAGDAAVVLRCNAGGVAWPDIIAFYGPTASAGQSAGIRLLGWGYVTDLGGDDGENATVQSMVPKDGGVRASWLTQQDGDPGCCATQTVSATLRPAGGSITVQNVVHETEKPVAATFFGALGGGDAAAARAVADPAVAGDALSDAGSRAALKAAAAEAPTCAGVNSTDLPRPIDAVVGIGGNGQPDVEVQRYCWVGADEVYGLAGLTQGGNGWRVVWWHLVTRTGG